VRASRREKAALKHGPISPAPEGPLHESLRAGPVALTHEIARWPSLRDEFPLPAERERVRERGARYDIVFRQCFQGFPLSPALSPLVPRGEREKTKHRLLPCRCRLSCALVCKPVSKKCVDIPSRIWDRASGSGKTFVPLWPDRSSREGRMQNSSIAECGMRNADWEKRNRAIADYGGRGRQGEASGRFGVRVGHRAVRVRVGSGNG